VKCGHGAAGTGNPTPFGGNRAKRKSYGVLRQIL
jgi:hypothetical protein